MKCSFSYLIQYVFRHAEVVVVSLDNDPEENVEDDESLPDSNYESNTEKIV